MVQIGIKTRIRNDQVKSGFNLNIRVSFWCMQKYTCGRVSY